MSGYKSLSKCVACGSDHLVPVLDLGKQPLANSYKLNKEDVQEEYPLAINRCDDCYHVQLTHAVDPHLMFDDYLYVSGTSKTGHEHFAQFAADYVNLSDRLNPKLEKSVLDVGCNDGTQLDYFKKLGWNTFGVDPAVNLLELSSHNHDIFCGYLDEDYVEKMNGKKFDLITAQNVFAHTADPLYFLLMAKELMNDDSLLCIQTSQANMIINNEFDTIYHEHISFFNTNSMDKLCQRAGLNLVSVDLYPIHGTSYVFVISKNPNHKKNIEERLKFETDNGIFKPETYVKYAARCDEIVEELVKAVSDYTRNDVGWFAVGYGAPAKGMTLLNYSGLKLDFIVDDNPLKQGRFTPGSSIPIYPASKLDDHNDAIIFVPLAWNFYDEIKKKIIARRNNQYDKFCLYFPTVRVES